MITDWLRPVEHVVLAARKANLRFIGITSPHMGSGVSTLAREVAENYSRSGIRTLLINFTEPVGDVASHPNWVPGQNAPLKLIRMLPGGCDQLTCFPTRETRFLFNNAQLLRRTLENEFDQYAAVILDLPPLLAKQSNLLNGLATATTCDAVCIVCRPGVNTHDELTTISDMLNAAHITLFGIVLNDIVKTRKAKRVEKRAFANSALG